jgi:hypothetical protein
MKANVHEFIVFLISISACRLRASRSYNIAIKKRFRGQSSISGNKLIQPSE